MKAEPPRLRDLRNVLVYLVLLASMAALALNVASQQGYALLSGRLLLGLGIMLVGLVSSSVVARRHPAQIHAIALEHPWRFAIGVAVWMTLCVGIPVNVAVLWPPKDRLDILIGIGTLALLFGEGLCVARLAARVLKKGKWGSR